MTAMQLDAKNHARIAGLGGCGGANHDVAPAVVQGQAAGDVPLELGALGRVSTLKGNIRTAAGVITLGSASASGMLAQYYATPDLSGAPSHHLRQS